MWQAYHYVKQIVTLKKQLQIIIAAYSILIYSVKS